MLDRGARLVEILKQGQYSPLTVSEQVVSIYAGVRGYLDKVAVNDVVRFETEVLNEMRSSHADLLEAIANEKELSKEIPKTIKKSSNKGSKFFSYLIVFIISFVALIILLDTLKTPIINVFPGLEIILFNLFETLQDLKLFIIDLI